MVSKKGMFILGLLLVSGLSSRLLADSRAADAAGHLDHDHEEHESEFDPTRYKLVLQGTQGFDEACYLGVIEELSSPDGSWTVTVETSFEHDGEGPGQHVLTWSPAQAVSVLNSQKADQSRLSIQLKEGASSLRDALRYAASWSHEGHTDRGLCSDLKVLNPSEG